MAPGQNPSTVTCMSSPVIAAADGSSLGNPGPGGWSWWISDARWEAGGLVGPVTNNAMELTALARLLEHLQDEPARILLDSRYVLDAVERWAHGWARNGWTTKAGTPVANVDLVRQTHQGILDRRRRGVLTELTWVRGHNGHYANEAADTRAREAAETARRAGSDLRLRGHSLS